MGLNPSSKNHSIKYIRISNTGVQDEFVTMTVLDSNGNPMQIIPSKYVTIYKSQVASNNFTP